MALVLQEPSQHLNALCSVHGAQRIRKPRSLVDGYSRNERERPPSRWSRRAKARQSGSEVGAGVW
jgi:hypothetical protein